MEIRQIAGANPGIAELLTRLQQGGHHLWAGVDGSQRALLIDLLLSRGRGPILFITANLKDAETLLADYEFFSGEKGFLFPNKPTLGAEVDAESHELENQRVLALSMAATARPCLVAAPATALLELLPPPEHIREGALELAPGDTAAIEELSARLTELGYQRVERVEAPGQFSRRGDILDVFPPGVEPCRIQFFDVQVESLRSIDLETQRSQQELASLHLGPARLLVLNQEIRRRVLDKLQERARTVSPLFLTQLEEDRERFSHLQFWPGYQHYMQYMFAGTYQSPGLFCPGPGCGLRDHRHLPATGAAIRRIDGAPSNPPGEGQAPPRFTALAFPVPGRGQVATHSHLTPESAHARLKALSPE